MVLLARLLTNPARRSALLTFTACSLLVFLPPLAGLVCTLYDALKYILSMGLTFRRIVATEACLAGFLAVALFLLWACRYRYPMPRAQY